MTSILNFFIFLFYIISAVAIWRLMSSHKKNYGLQVFVWILWILAIIGHLFTILPIVYENYSVNLSLDYAFIVVGFIISITLYISSILGNTQYLGIIILPIISSSKAIRFSNVFSLYCFINFLLWPLAMPPGDIVLTLISGAKCTANHLVI